MTHAMRSFLAEALEQANIFNLRNADLVAAFIDGRVDLPIDTLDMDSLAEMELCIAIEVNTGISIVPEQLRQIQTLGGLASIIAGAPID